MNGGKRKNPPLGASPRLVQAPAWCKPLLGASLRLVQAKI